MKQKRSYTREELIEVVYHILTIDFRYGLKLFDKYAVKSIFKSANTILNFSNEDIKQVTKSTGEESVVNDIKWCVKTLFEQGYLTRMKDRNGRSWVYYVATNRRYI